MGLRKARIYFVELLLDNRDVKLNFFSFLGYNIIKEQRRLS